MYCTTFQMFTEQLTEENQTAYSITKVDGSLYSNMSHPKLLITAFCFHNLQELLLQSVSLYNHERTQKSLWRYC